MSLGYTPGKKEVKRTKKERGRIKEEGLGRPRYRTRGSNNIFDGLRRVHEIGLTNVHIDSFLPHPVHFLANPSRGLLVGGQTSFDRSVEKKKKRTKKKRTKKKRREK